MITPFEDLPADAKLWVYPAQKKLEDIQIYSLNRKIESFLSTWEAHQKPLKGAFLWRENYFLIVGVDSSFNVATGCSIDKLVSFIKSLSVEGNIDFMNLGKVFIESNNSITAIQLSEIKNSIEQEKLSAETTVFNASITSKDELNTNWKVKAKNTWLKRYFTAKPAFV